MPLISKFSFTVQSGASQSANYVDNFRFNSQIPATFTNLRPNTGYSSPYGYQNTFYFYGDANTSYLQGTQVFNKSTELIISWISNDGSCQDIGLAVAPNGTNPTWNWGTTSDVVRYQNNCSGPTIYLPGGSAPNTSYSFSAGTWYTSRASYNPATGFSRFRQYVGIGTSGALVTDLSGTAYSWPNYRWAINADPDSNYTWIDYLTIRDWDNS